MKIGIADTTFARINMGQIAIDTISNRAQIERYTVPGFKDLPVACKKLIEEHGCKIVIALAWVGKEDIDETCAHEANIGLIHCELLTSTHIMKVFFHEKEEIDELKQKKICLDRIQKHTENALKLIQSKTALTPTAGQGLRQGYNHTGEIK